MSVHWLSQPPTVYRDSIYVCNDSLEEEKEALRKQAQMDWEKFLLMRSRELREGGVLFVGAPAAYMDEKTCRVRFSGETLVTQMTDIWKSFTVSGKITRQEFIKTNISFCLRNLLQMREPFEAENSQITASGLSLLSSEIILNKNIYYSSWIQKKDEEGIDDREEFAEMMVSAHRNWSNHSFMAGLSDTRSLKEKKQILDEFYTNLNMEIARMNPELFKHDYSSDKYREKEFDNKHDDENDDKEDDDFEDTDTDVVDDLDPYNPSDKQYIQDSLGSCLKYYTKIFLPPRPDPHKPQRPVVPKGKMWTDPDFPRPMKIKLNKKVCLLEWKRPHKIYSNPVLFHEQTERGDINQRSFGTCWFLAMVANIAENPVLRRKVINEMSYTPRTDGVFHCRMWRFRDWVDIYTDDLLPVRKKSVFLFGAAAPSLSGEVWVSLLEKALARLHGSYSVVEGGWPSDAYLSLTGGVAETIDFATYNDHPYDLFRRTANALGSGGLVTCCNLADEDNMGLVRAHAYSLTGAEVVMRHDGEMIPLVRIRNPHGHQSEEWHGKWSDR
ncbi:calpain-type cysteine protease ADL1-like [Haliotis rubra]|uniref:calpain-type cysteine protease ADL1-like n=1 Tax=Haliotis rubra TaxID=36100 RepID=UPI001EE5E4B2|nr:calpain-type cysteine protease ADL1-like [Haliotis rubra]